MNTTFRRMPALAGLVAVFLAAAVAPGARGGDDSAILKIMEQVNTRNRAINKGLRNFVATDAAGRKTLAAEPARERKKSQQEWARTVDDFLRASEEFATVIAEPGSSQPRAKQFYQKLQKTCINCHSAFREG
jgi:hypothetical protein